MHATMSEQYYSIVLQLRLKMTSEMFDSVITSNVYVTKQKIK